MKPSLYLLFLVVVVGIQTSQGASWQVSVFIGTREYSQSSDTLIMDVQGTTNSLSEIIVGNNFQRGEIRRFSVEGDFGKINTIRLYQRSDDGIRVRMVVLEDEDGRTYTFGCDCWIQTDQPADDSKPSWTLNYMGAVWQVSVFIGTREYSQSSDTLIMDVQGTTNSLSEISLGNNFRQGEIRRIFVEEDFGKINTIRLYQRSNDGIRVRKVVLQDEDGRPYTFDCDCWIQTDQPADDSKPSWTLNSLNCYWNDSIPHCAEVVRVSCQTGKCDMCNEGYILQNDECRCEYPFLVFSGYSPETCRYLNRL